MSWNFVLNAFCVLIFRSFVAAVEPGSIRGVVRFPGETPPGAMVVNETDERCPSGIPQDHLIVQQTNRGLKNVLVVLEADPVRMKPWAPVPLANDKCTFAPRVQWVPVSTAVLLKNPGVADHRVRAWRESSVTFDVTLAPGNEGVRRPMVNAGFYKINCEQHLWERSWLYVSENPYVAITNEKGEFEIKDVPSGNYSLRAWHEGWTIKGKDKQGRTEFQPREEVIRVKVRSEDTTDVLFERLSPTF